MDTPDTCAKKLKSLVIKIKDKFPNTKISFFEITFREDIYLATNIEEVNKKLKEISAKHEVVFIGNSSIDNTCLNGSITCILMVKVQIFSLPFYHIPKRRSIPKISLPLL